MQAIESCGLTYEHNGDMTECRLAYNHDGDCYTANRLVDLEARTASARAYWDGWTP